MKSGSYNISALVGETKVIDFFLYADATQTTPFNLTGYTVTVVLSLPNFRNEPATVLAVGSGLAVDPTAGHVTLTQDTASWEVGQGRWYMQLVDPGGATSYPLRGILYVGTP